MPSATNPNECVQVFLATFHFFYFKSLIILCYYTGWNFKQTIVAEDNGLYFIICHNGPSCCLAISKCNKQNKSGAVVVTLIFVSPKPLTLFKKRSTIVKKGKCLITPLITTILLNIVYLNIT